MQTRLVPPLWRTIVGSGVALALGAGLIDWLDYRHPLQPAPAWWYGGLIASLFLALGWWTGWRLHQPAAIPREPISDAAPAQRLGISPRELEVLDAIARGLTTKEVARALGVSPNTVKTHTSRLFEKLSATTRTGAAARARALGVLR